MFEKRKQKSSKQRKKFSRKKAFFEWLETASKPAGN
jgi:hypothetical protein